MNKGYITIEASVVVPVILFGVFATVLGLMIAYERGYVKASEYFKNGHNKTNDKLVEMDYFTDTEKDYTGVNRPTFMTLAPNSVTKVRVYIWIEGQDIDNYDFASLGQQITVSFGFTKERFTQEEIASPSA